MRGHSCYRSLLFAILDLLFSMETSGGVVDPTIPSKIDVFVLSGQSNMSGRGGVVNGTWDHVVPPQCSPNPSILRLDAHRHWINAHEPLHADIDTKKVCGVGPGMSFANAVLKHYPCPEKARTGLVPCAIGGTALKEWEKGSQLYDMMISRTKSALKRGGVLKALLWYQGESDALNETTANSYKDNLVKLIHDIRSDLKHPNLLFIQVAIHVEDQTPAELVEKIRETQLNTTIPNVFTVDAKGLPLKPDKLHLTTEAQVKLGEMLAKKYLEHSNMF